VKQLSNLVLVFAIAFTFFIIVPGVISQPFSPYPLIKVSDVIDLITPVVIMPLYYLLLYYGSSKEPSIRSMIIFLVFVAIWVEGQGMHLAANSIGHWLSEVAGDEINQVTHFYDEVLSHYIWHFGVVALSAQLIYRERKHPLEEQIPGVIFESMAGILYGLTIAIMGLEGGTVPLLFPFSALAALVCVLWGRGKFHQQKILTFFLVGYGLASLVFIVWGLYFGGFPQPSELGII
jgi:hypothetical protein